MDRTLVGITKTQKRHVPCSCHHGAFLKDLMPEDGGGSYAEDNFEYSRSICGVNQQVN